jgi:hypothetical protein
MEIMEHPHNVYLDNIPASLKESQKKKKKKGPTALSLFIPFTTSRTSHSPQTGSLA